MTQRLILLISLMVILLLTAAVVYTYPEKWTVTTENPQKNTQIAEWKREALHLYHNAESVDCELLVQRILRAEPQELDALHLLALLRHRTEDFAEEERLYRKILSFAPDDAAAHNNLGVLLCSTGRKKDGFCELSVASVLLPEEPVIRYNLLHSGGKSGSVTLSKPEPPPVEKFPLLLISGNNTRLE